MKLKRIIYLGGEKISVGGGIEKMKCSNCDFKSDRLTLHSDTDMVYMGVVGLTDLKQNRIVITHLSKPEWKNYKNQVPEELQNRINRIFNTDSFVFFDLIQFQNDSNGEKSYKPICPKCSNSLNKVRFESFDEFIEKGGQILSLDVYEE